MLLSLAVSVSAAETTLTVTVPFADTNEDGLNDYVTPENAGIFVITVDKENEIETGAYLNKGRNTTDKKLSGDYIDSELDVIYYSDDDGASYTLSCEEGTLISLWKGSIQ